MIKLIDTKQIYPHPNNPRKDLGDLTELADSIKQTGILQNLTIVPWDSNVPEWGETEQRYYAVIGHRRLAAAKLAGLEKVPCSIVDMDHKTQVATMLLENMQRVDLTIYEQAQGFQMMMDLGEDITNISEKTGFSETTVRRRMKLLELDQKKLEESTTRGVTLIEYMELFEIKDPDLRNEVLESAGTENFKWRLMNAKDKETRKEWEERITSLLDSFAVEVKERRDDFAYVRSYNDTIVNEEIIAPEDADTRKYFYLVHSYGQITLYAETEKEMEEEIKEREEARERKAERDARINEVKTRTSKLREDFIYSLTNTKLIRYIGDILLLATEARTSFHMWESDYIKAFKLKAKEEDFDFDIIEKDIVESPALSLLKIIYSEDLRNSSYFNYRGEYSEDKALDKLYDILMKAGYELSDEERELKEGTHELYEQDN